MNQAVTVARNGGDIMESVLLKGDLSKLTAAERVDYYRSVCESIGLNPLTQPFAYLTLNGKLMLYAKRDAADQLRKINGISIEIVSQKVTDGLLTVHVRAKDATGRTDEDMGVVNIAGLKGEAAANAALKAVTKAKRRVTLSIAGLGFLDESEVEDIPSARPATAAPPKLASPETVAAMGGDPITGEVGPRKIDVNGNWLTFGSTLIAWVNAATDKAEIDAWLSLNGADVKAMESEAPKAYERVKAAVIGKREALSRSAETPTNATNGSLSPADSAALLKALSQKLLRCKTVAAIDKWNAETRADYASLTGADRKALDEGEDFRREQLHEPGDEGEEQSAEPEAVSG